MKKLIALLIALILGLFSTIPAGADVNSVDTPQETKIVEWAIAYSKRCRNYTGKVRHINHHYMRRALLMPMMVMLGTTYRASYTKDGVVKEKDYTDYGEGRMAINILHKAGYKDARLKTIEEKASSSPEEIARNSSVGFIRKVTLLTGTEEIIPMPGCTLKRRAKKLGFNVFDIFMKIDAHINEYDEESATAVTAEMQQITAEKYVDTKGCAWKPLLASASDKRNSTFLCIREDVYNAWRTWLVGKVDLKYIRMVVSKYLVYMGLQTSASKTMKEVFGYSFAFDRIAVIKDLNTETASAKDVWFVNSDNTVTVKKNHKEPLNAFDGIAIYFDDVIQKYMPKSLWKKLTKAFSGRFGIMTKFLVIPQKREEYKAKLEELGHDGYITQIDGTKVHVDDVDVILTESCFKGKALFQTVKAWADACIENEYECAVCVQQHKKDLKDMPYQQGQLLKGTSADALGLASHAIATVQKWTKPEEAAKLLGGYLGAACELYPPLLKTRYVQKVLQDRYTKRRNSMIAGKVPEVGYSVFVAPDPLALFCHIFGLPIQTQIEEDECILDWADEGAEVVLTRNPDTDGCPICKNKKHGWGCAPGVLYINPFSWVPILLRLDYDGDHVLVIIDPLVVKLYKQTYERINKMPIVWVAPAGEKNEINDATIAEALMASMAGTQTGIHSDNLTKLWNISKEDLEMLKEKFGESIIEDLIAIETYNVNVDIDSTKNAANKTKKSIDAIKKLAALKALMLPRFCRFSKATEQIPADSEHWDKRCKYTGSLLDIYSRTCESKLPVKLEVKGLDKLVFSVHKLMFDPHRSLQGYAGLACEGNYDKETKMYDTEGLYNHTAFMSSKLWRLILDSENKKTHNEMRDAIKEETMKIIKAFVEAQGGDLQGAYDVIVRWLFIGTSKMTDGYFDVVARHFMDVFAEKMFCAVCMNTGVDYGNTVVDDDDDDDDDMAA